MTAPPRLLAAAKINLFLKITGRRPDGLHDLSSLVCFADYGDYLECAPDSAPEYAPAGEDRLALGGPLADALEEAGGAGLITAALQALREAGCAIPPLAVRLEKNLPTGGGLGGGSADAAALLRFLPDFFDQPLPPEQLARLAAGLGADVPACLAGGWLHITGIGTQIRELAAPQRLPFAVLANAGISVPTGPVFAAWSEAAKPSQPLDEAVWLAALQQGDWPFLLQLGNDLTGPAKKLHPGIADLLEVLEETGRRTGGDFLGAAMSGSGSSCFALMASQSAAEQMAADLTGRGLWAVSCALQGSAS